jgi:hypothetical protein
MCLFCSWRMNATQSFLYAVFKHLTVHNVGSIHKKLQVLYGIHNCGYWVSGKAGQTPTMNLSWLPEGRLWLQNTLLLELETVHDSAQLDFIHERCFWTSTMYHFSALSHMWLTCLLHPWTPRMWPWIPDFSITIVLSYAATLKLLVI